MTGPEHYLEAERLLRNAAEITARFAGLADGVRDAEVSNGMRLLVSAVTAAGAHATLALAAATIAGSHWTGSSAVASQWRDAGIFGETR